MNDRIAKEAGLLLKSLYDYHFRNGRAQTIVHLIAFTISLGYMSVSDLLLRRSIEASVLGGLVVSALLVVALPLLFVFRPSRSGLQRGVEDPLNSLRRTSEPRINRYHKEELGCRSGEHPIKIKILFLSANPQDIGGLRLHEEVRAIKVRLGQAEYRNSFSLEQEFANSFFDIQRSLQSHSPQIVHFSGHGSDAGQIVLSDHSGNRRAVPQEALKTLFETFRGTVSCVVLNACFSEPQASAIAQKVDYVVGMSGAIDDDASITFAAAFYLNLSCGRSVREAFELGCNELYLYGLRQSDIPKLICR